MSCVVQSDKPIMCSLSACSQPPLHFAALRATFQWPLYTATLQILSKSITQYIFKSCVSGLVMCTADVLAQIYVDNREWTEIQKPRTIKFTSVGILFTGPLLAYWSTIMQRSIIGTASPLSKALQRSIATQIFLAPSLNFGIITCAGAINGLMPTKINVRNTLQGDFLTIMEKNFMVWLPVQFVGCITRHSFVKYALLNFVSIIWFAYLSSILMH